MLNSNTTVIRRRNTKMSLADFSPKSRAKKLAEMPLEALTAQVAEKISKGETPLAAETREYLMRTMEKRHYQIINIISKPLERQFSATLIGKNTIKAIILSGLHDGA